MRRYAKLLGQPLTAPSGQSIKKPVDPLTEAELLLGLTLDYDGRSWFAGYIKKGLWQRRMDRKRKDGRDALSKRREPLAGKEAAAAREADNKSSDAKDAILSDLETAQRLDQLAEKLTPKQRKIVELRRKAFLSDKDVADRIGVSRENVNREMGKIRKTASGGES